jgi:hypothetical protein
MSSAIRPTPSKFVLLKSSIADGLKESKLCRDDDDGKQMKRRLDWNSRE